MRCEYRANFTDHCSNDATLVLTVPVWLRERVIKETNFVCMWHAVKMVEVNVLACGQEYEIKRIKP